VLALFARKSAAIAPFFSWGFFIAQINFGAGNFAANSQTEFAANERSNENDRARNKLDKRCGEIESAERAA